MRSIGVLFGCGAVLLLAMATPLAGRDVSAILAPTTDFSKPESFERNPGGATTHTKLVNKDAFSEPAANLSFEERAEFTVGNGFFKRVWVTAPASTQAADGLGPLYNARSCQRCHLNDGRGHPPNGSGDSRVSMFLRLSIPPEGEGGQDRLEQGRGDILGEPTYGTQLQDLAIAGHKAEGRMLIEYMEIPIRLEGGAIARLRRPSYSIDRLGYGALHPDVMLSPRVAQPMIGLGLLEAIADEDILAHADPDDLDKDGISGRPNRVPDLLSGEAALGRFGWKALNPSLLQQSSTAFAGDIGISNPLVRTATGDCTRAQRLCQEAPDGNSPQYEGLEAPSVVMEKILFYVRHLAVPARRDLYDEQVLRGKELFYGSGCTGCHVPKFITRRDAASEALSYELIWPYTDLLLHDMGEGLADHRPEGQASGREWRTPPLWGIGLTEEVSGHTFFLHDGRARNLTEAILWHDGEARAARDAFAAMPEADRRALLAFLGSL
jgi:CxxC motif-containing protein (DUF1111 family)